MDIGGALMRQRSVASIPSKFETILHEGGRENNAFWNRTHRFTYTDNEMPGAGQYHKAGNPERVAPSYSQKGYTGMVSKSSRFVPLRRASGSLDQIPARAREQPLHTRPPLNTRVQQYTLAPASRETSLNYTRPEYKAQNEEEGSVRLCCALPTHGNNMVGALKTVVTLDC